MQQKASSDGIELEDTLEPLLLLLRKTSSEDADLRATLCSILLPSDLDRSVERRGGRGRCWPAGAAHVLGDAAALRAGCRRAAALAVRRRCQAHDRDEWLRSLCGLPHEHGSGLGAAVGVAAGTGANGRAVDPITGEYEPTEGGASRWTRSTA